jgi:NADH-quinone oxidoreductase subunit G
VIGEKADLTYDYDYLGAGTDTLGRTRRKNAPLLKKAKRPLVLVGQGALARADGAAVLAMAAKARSGLACSRTAGTALACCIRQPRASARSISASCRARAGSMSPA